MTEDIPISMIATFAAFQVIGCITTIASMIYIKKYFLISNPIYLLALLDAVFSFVGFLILFVCTMTIGLIAENDPNELKEFESIGCIIFGVAMQITTLLGPFFMAHISFLRLLSVKANNSSLAKKLNIAIALLFTFVVVVSCAAPTVATKNSIFPIQQVCLKAHGFWHLLDTETITSSSMIDASLVYGVPRIASMLFGAIMDLFTALHINRKKEKCEHLYAKLRTPLKTSKKMEIPLKTCILSIFLGIIDISLVVIFNIPSISVKHKALILISVLLTINICRLPAYLKLSFLRNQQNMSRSLSVKRRQQEERRSASLRRSTSLRRSSTLPENLSRISSEKTLYSSMMNTPVQSPEPKVTNEF